MKRFVLLLSAATLVASCQKPSVQEEEKAIVIDAVVTMERPSTAHEFEIPLKTNVTSNFEMDIHTDERGWITHKGEKTRALSSKKLVFSVTKNTNPEPRTATITITGDGVKSTFRVVQKAPTAELSVKIVDADNMVLTTTVVDNTIRLDKKISEFGGSFRIIPESADVTIDVWVDDAFQKQGEGGAFPWVRRTSKESVLPIVIEVGSARTGDIFDYSTNRRAVVHMAVRGSSLRQDIELAQESRVAGHYILSDASPNEIPDRGDLLKESRIGKLIFGEHEAFRMSMSSIVIENAEGVNVPLTADDLLAISKYVPNLKSLDLSRTIVETIPKECFKNNATLESLALPEGLKTIGESAFSGTQLKTINLPSTLTAINRQAFYLAPVASPIVIPAGLETLGEAAFKGNKLTGLSFAELQPGQTRKEHLKIPKEAFYATNGGGLKNNLEIPDWVSEIGDKAFSGLGLLSDTKVELKIGQNVEKIDVGAFSNNKNITKITFADGGKNITFTKSRKPSGIADGYFGNTGLKVIVLPMHSRCSVADGIVPSYMFAGCDDIETITLDPGITVIGEGAFAGAAIKGDVSFLKDITKIDASGLGGFTPHAVKNGEGKLIGGGEMDLSVCTKLTTLGDRAFYNSIYVTKFIFPASITSWGKTLYSAVNFAQTEANLTSFAFTEFPQRLFSGIAKLKKIEVSKKLTSIPEGTINGCAKGLVILFPEGFTGTYPALPADAPEGTKCETAQPKNPAGGK